MDQKSKISSERKSFALKRLARFRPKSTLDWAELIFGAIVTLIYLKDGLSSLNGGIILVLTGMLLFLAIWFAHPPAVVRGFGKTAIHYVRLGTTVFFYYTVVVLIGHAREISGLENTSSVLFLTSGVSFTVIHLIGIAIGLRAIMDRGFVESFVGLLGRIFRFSTNAPSTNSGQDGSVHSESDLVDFERVVERMESHDAPDRIHWGRLNLPSEFASDHFLAVGEPGSGKTLMMRLLMQTALPLLGRRPTPGRAVIFDSKHEWVSLLSNYDLAVPVHNFNPFDARGMAWDVAKDISNPLMAHRLASEWFSGRFATDVVTGVVEVLISRAGQQWRLRDLAMALKSPDQAATVLSMGKSTAGIAEKLRTDPECRSEFESLVSSRLHELKALAAANEAANSNGSLSINDWVESESVLVIGHPADIEPLARTLDRLLFFRIASVLLDADPADTGLSWIVIDDLDQAGRHDSLDQLLSQGRSKGTCSVLGLNSASRLDKIYGEGFATRLASVCGNVAFLNTHDSATARIASERIGAIDLTALEKPSRESNHGFEGIGAVTATNSSFRFAYPSVDLSAQLTPPDFHCPNFEKRPEPVLHDWDIVDLQRLSFLDRKYELLLDAPASTQPESDRQTLKEKLPTRPKKETD